ncbi:MAG: fibronectin type III domain-containing protein, partial [Flavobacteriales bacterium]|nr:fibronectin type III domain-containing protein [Flavobacteriales bacterium]
MKNFTKWLAMLLLVSTWMQAQLFQVATCNGTIASNTYGPMNSTATSGATNRTAVIYPSSQLAGMSGQTLNAIYFKRLGAAGAMTGTPNFKVYLKQTSLTTFGTGAQDWATLISGATLVYDTNPSAAIGTTLGWKQFQFSNNFLYTGTSNLMVIMEYVNTGNTLTIGWEYEYSSPCVNTGDSNTTKYTNNTTGTPGASLASQDYRRPWIAFDFLVSCNAPTGAIVNNVSTNSATATWTAGASAETTWEYAVQPSGGGIPTTNIQTTTSNNISLTGLQPASNYQFYVRAFCGVGDTSVWVGPINFSTQCAPVTSFFENFDALTVSGTTTLANCWSRIGTSTTTYVTTGSVAPMSPSNRMLMTASGTATPPTTGIAVLPQVTNLNAGTHRFRFTAYGTTAGASIGLGYMTDPADASTFVLLTNFSLPGTAASTAQEFTFEVPTSVPAGATNLALRNQPPTGVAYTVYFDNVAWEPIPACSTPNGLSASNVSTTQATLAWNGSINHTSWEIEYGPTGFTQGTGTIVPANTNPFVLASINSSTAYQFYVRAICAGPQATPWSAVGTFTTACANIIPPALETFNTFPPICWTRAQNGTPATGPQGGTTFNWVADGFLNNGTTGAAKFNIYTTNRQGWLITPTYDLSAGGYQVFYDIGATQFGLTTAITGNNGNMGPDDELYFLMSVDNGTTWTTVELFNESNTPPVNGTTRTYNIASVNSPTVRFAFFANSGPTNTPSTDYDVFVDNFSVASCLPPSSLSTSSPTTNSVNLNWTASVSNPADGYQWEVRTSGAAGSGTTGLVQSGSVGVGITTAAVSGLTPSTAYQYYVRSVCSATDNSVWIQGPNFTTLCDLVTEFSQNFDTTTAGTGILPPCWSRSGSSTVANVIGSAAAPFSAPNRLQMSAVFNSTVAYVLMPPVSNLQAETHRLRFKAFATTTGRNIDLGYFTDESDLNTFVLLESIPVPGTTQAIAEELFAFPAGIPTGVSRLVFRNLPSATGTSLIYIDDVIWQPIPDCLNPTFLSATNIQHNSAQLQWVSNAGEFEWDIKYGAPGFNPATEGTLVAGIFDNPYVLTGLAGATNYSYYVRAVCDSGSNNVSPWEGPFNFRTKCDLVTTFSENFDALTAGANTLANCWGRLGNTATNNVVTGSVAPMSPSNRYNIVSNFAAAPPTFGLAVMPGVSNLNAGTHRLRFTAFSTTANAQISIGYLTNPDDPGSFVVLSNLTLPGIVAANAQEIFYEVPNTVPAGVNYLAIRNQSAAGSVSVFFDNVAWEPIPSCPNPTALSTSGVTSTQATLAWSASVNNTSWEIEYGITGFTQGSGTIVSASTNPFVLTGLTPATTYQFYVRGVCAGPENSVWSQVGSFTT